MKTIIKYLQLPLYFDVARLQQEVMALGSEWQLHYQASQYEGEWSALPLRSINGSLTNLMVDAATGEQFADTPLMAICPYIKRVTDALDCEKTTVRLLKLQPGAIIKEHKDMQLNFENGEARIHVPIITNDAVEFYLDNAPLTPKEGECWYMNFNLKHRLANNGTTARIHLVIDCKVSDWMREIFSSDACPVKRVIPEPELHTLAEKQSMIASFLAMNTPQALLLAQELERSISEA